MPVPKAAPIDQDAKDVETKIQELEAAYRHFKERLRAIAKQQHVLRKSIQEKIDQQQLEKVRHNTSS